MHHRVEAQETPPPSSFAKVTSESTRVDPAPSAVAPAPAPDSPQLPAATAARRVAERQRPIPVAGKSAADDQAADPSALLALADQVKADPEAKEVKSVPAPAPAPKAEPKADEAAPAAEEKKELPESLSRGLIQKGFSGVKSKVAACKDKAPEDTTVISVTAVIDPDGSVEEVQVDDPVGSSPAAACVIAAVKSARFAEFSGQPQTVSYPFPVK